MVFFFIRLILQAFLHTLAHSFLRSSTLNLISLHLLVILKKITRMFRIILLISSRLFAFVSHPLLPLSKNEASALLYTSLILNIHFLRFNHRHRQLTLIIDNNSSIQ